MTPVYNQHGITRPRRDALNSWHHTLFEDAACVGRADVFDQASRDPWALYQALELCDDCPVKAACYSRAKQLDAQSYGGLYGLWAGLWWGQAPYNRPQWRNVQAARVRVKNRRDYETWEPANG